jgi:hypothetical protein
VMPQWVPPFSSNKSIYFRYLAAIPAVAEGRERWRVR